MIGSLRGVLAAQLSGDEVLVEVGGVGYRVVLANGTRASLGAPGSEIFLHVHTHVREDALVLYGFVDEATRECFEALLGAHGVGPSLALSVLSVLSPGALQRAVEEGDVATLCAVPGIGRKTAARLLLDLKDHLGSLGSTMPSMMSGEERSARAEARAALDELGYGPEEIRRALEGRGEDLGVEELLRHALRELATR